MSTEKRSIFHTGAIHPDTYIINVSFDILRTCKIMLTAQDTKSAAFLRSIFHGIIVRNTTKAGASSKSNDDDDADDADDAEDDDDDDDDDGTKDYGAITIVLETHAWINELTPAEMTRLHH